MRVEAGAGAWLGFADDDYGAAGARIDDVDGVWDAELVVKVKEIQLGEEMRIDGEPAVFGFQHLVGDPEMTRRLAARGATAIAFELVRDAAGALSAARADVGDRGAHGRDHGRAASSRARPGTCWCSARATRDSRRRAPPRRWARR